MKGKSFIAGTVLFLAAIPLAVNAANWNPLPDTGQTTCYDVAGSVIPCPAEGQPLNGQDGNYIGQQQNYQDNGDGTITDLNTGLMWQQSDSGIKFYIPAAYDYCNNLDLGGHGDWRLPEWFELRSIVDHSRISPAINPVFSCQSDWYWSSTPDARFSQSRRGVGFNYGFNIVSLTINNRALVRCVRAEL